MLKKKWKYDIAISFLSQDEMLAIELAEMLRDRVSVFVYPEQQKRLVGADGIEQFSSVFKEESRIVVVLYREGWGKTAWTKIEEESIKSRGLNPETGWDFVLLVLVDPTSIPPRWLPNYRIWGDFQRLGTKGITAIIEERVRSAGGSVASIDPTIYYTEKLDRKLEYKKKRDSWQRSTEGVKEATEEAQKICFSLKNVADSSSKETSHVKLVWEEGKGRPGNCILFGHGISMVMNWQYSYDNSLDGAKLLVRFLRGRIFFGGISPYEDPEPIDTIEFNVDLGSDGKPFWIDPATSKQYSTESLMEKVIKDFTGIIGAEEERNTDFY